MHGDDDNQPKIDRGIIGTGSNKLMVSTALTFLLLLRGCTSAQPPLKVDKPTPFDAVVYTPAGHPAAGAQAALVPAGHWAEIVNGLSIDGDPAYQRCKADGGGRVHFPGLPGRCLVVVVDSSGFARVDWDALAGTRQIQLQAWARVEGRMRVGGGPGADLDIVANVIDDHPYDVEFPQVNAYSRAKTDAQGRFVIDRIPPGNLEVAREFNFMMRGNLIGTGVTQRTRVSAAPGQTVSVELGGNGRPVVGRFVLPGELEGKTDWDFGLSTAGPESQQTPLPMPQDVQGGPPNLQQKWYEQFIQTEAGKAYLAAESRQMSSREPYPVQTSRDGTFRVEDLPAGPTMVEIEIRGDIDQASRKAGKLVASGATHFVIPPIPGGRSDEPLQVPDVVIAMLPQIPEVGDMAPGFVTRTFDGEELKLSDLRGKYVLLEFWASWCGPCLARTPDLKAVFEKFARTGRIAMVSLSVDDLPFKPKQYVDQHEMKWIQGFLGPRSPVAQEYGVNSIPSFWIIDPTGKIVAKPKFDADLKAAVSAALAQGGR